MASLWDQLLTLSERRKDNIYDTILTMGQHQIVNKLKLEFDGEITSERQVVYILVEIGKLLEHDKLCPKV